MSYKILILDDDNDILEWVSSKISSNFPNTECICFNNYKDFLKSLNSIKYDFVITDIMFGEVNSIKVYDVISKKSTIPLVYMSGNDTRTFDVYDTPHIYFLAKPIDEERLIKAVERLMNSNEILTFDYFKKSYSVDLKDIMYLESDRRLIHIVTKDNIYQTYGKLDDFVNRVPSYFVRISKSFIINKKFVREVSSSTVTMKNGEIFNIARSMKKGTFDVL